MKMSHRDELPDVPDSMRLLVTCPLFLFTANAQRSLYLLIIPFSPDFAVVSVFREIQSDVRLYVKKPSIMLVHLHVVDGHYRGAHHGNEDPNKTCSQQECTPNTKLAEHRRAVITELCKICSVYCPIALDM